MIITDIDQLISMWEKDSKLDVTEISAETAKIGSLHAKYSGIRIRHRLRALKAKTDYDRMVGIKKSYYKGEISDPETLTKYGWEQWPHNKVMNAAMPEVLAADTDLINLTLKRAIHDEIVVFAEAFIKEINSRTWQCKTILDAEKYFGPGPTNG